jgi:hypothetical protein
MQAETYLVITADGSVAVETSREREAHALARQRRGYVTDHRRVLISAQNATSGHQKSVSARNGSMRYSGPPHR